MRATCRVVPYSNRSCVQVGSAMTLWDEGSMRAFFTTFTGFYPCRTFSIIRFEIWMKVVLH